MEGKTVKIGSPFSLAAGHSCHRL